MTHDELVDKMRKAVKAATFHRPGSPECAEQMQAAMEKIAARTPEEQAEAVETWKRFSKSE